MAKILSTRNTYNVLRNTPVPSTHIRRNNVIPNALRIPEKSSDGEKLLRNLRMAVTPCYGYVSNTYETGETSSSSSSLAGDPKHLRARQDIRAEILEKWNKRPRPDIQKEWLKNIMFN